LTSQSIHHMSDVRNVRSGVGTGGLAVVRADRQRQHMRPQSLLGITAGVATALIASTLAFPPAEATASPGHQAAVRASAASSAAPVRPPSLHPVAPRRLPASLRSALTAARQRSRAVRVPAFETSNRIVVAKPSGVVTEHVFTGPVQVRRQGRWIPFSSRLVKASAGWRTQATPVSIHVGSGGEARTRTAAAASSPGDFPVASTLSASTTSATADVASLTTQDGSVLDVRWPGGLPVATVEGNTATYRNVAPGLDVKVTTYGNAFELSAVLTQRPAKPLSFSLPMRLTGLSVSQGADGLLHFTDAAGDEVASSSGVTMSGAAIDPRSGDPARSVHVPFALTQTADGPSISFTPDWSFLSDPATTYPVTIDPTYSDDETNTNGYDTYAYSPDPSTAEGAYDSTNELKIGTFDGGTSRANSYLWFNIGSLYNSDWTVNSASLRMYNYYSYSCYNSAQTPSTRIWGADAPKFTRSGTTSNNQPYTDGKAYIGSQDFSWGYSSACGGRNVTFDAQALAQRWSNGTEANNGIELSTSDNANSYGWKKFYNGAAASTSTQKPQLTISYDTNCDYYPSTGYQVCGATRTEYDAQGGATGPLGAPIANARTASSSPQGTTGTYQRFTHGEIDSSTKGTFAVVGANFNEFIAQSPAGTGSGLGFPTAEQRTATASPQGTTGTYQRFEGGEIDASSRGTFAVTGNMFTEFVARSPAGTGSGLGFPTRDLGTASSSPQGTTGTWQGFEGGQIDASVKGTFSVYGAVNDAYSGAGGTSSCLGFPVRDQYAIATGQQEDFETGNIALNASSISAVSCVTTPNPPTEVTSAVGGTTGYVDWTAPSSDGGSPITGYTVTASPGGQMVTTATTEAVFPGLNTATTYSFIVAATNAIGSTSVSATPVAAAPPPTPSAVNESSAAGSSTVWVDWQPPADVFFDNPNSVSSYTVTLASGGSTIATQSVDGLLSEAEFDNLTPGSSYSAIVAANNRFGAGTGATSALAIHAGVPEQATGLVVSSVEGAVAVTWDASVVSPDSYLVTATPEAGGASASTTVAGTATSATVAGLADFTPYDVTVAAQDSYGTTTTTYEVSVSPGPTDGQAVETTSTATVLPVHVSTPIDNAYTTEAVDADLLGGTTQVAVIDSSPPAQAAITGVVTDAGTGTPISGASVTLSSSDGSVAAAQATSDANGLYAFNDIPATSTGTAYDLDVTAPGYGQFTRSNDPYFAGQTYEADSALTLSPQRSNVQADFALASFTSAAPAATTAGAYPSSTIMPAVVRVDFWQPNHDNCDNKTEVDQHTIVKYPWRFYISHVAAGELGNEISNEGAIRANLVAESTFGWNRMKVGHRTAAGYDVRNTTDDQCFQPGAKVPTGVNPVIDDQLKYRISKKDGSLDPAYYLAGPKKVCPGSAAEHETLNGGTMSQNGSQLMAQQSSLCPANARLTDWKQIDGYFYVGSVHSAGLPPGPTTSYGQPTGAVTLHFPSRVSGVDVGWKYRVEALLRDPITHALTWQWIDTESFRWSDHSIHTQYTYSVSSCTQYRARTHNGVGWSNWAYVNSNNIVCPG
jgi:hypothetical protein